MSLHITNLVIYLCFCPVTVVKAAERRSLLVLASRWLPSARYAWCVCVCVRCVCACMRARHDLFGAFRPYYLSSQWRSCRATVRCSPPLKTARVCNASSAAAGKCSIHHRLATATQVKYPLSELRAWRPVFVLFLRAFTPREAGFGLRIITIAK